jgi:hypothetical protein
MISYNVFFTPKAGVDDSSVITVAHQFLEHLRAEKKLHGYRILRVTNPGSFPALPRYQAIVDFESQQALDEAFAFMRQPNKKEEGPHGELMRLVADFKVSFTADV